MTTTIHVGHVLDKLGEMPDKSDMADDTAADLPLFMEKEKAHE